MTAERIAFIHIPKTAGSSVIHAFEAALGESRCATFRIAIDDAAFAGKQFVSGHVNLCAVTPNAACFTFLREPLAQLASHLRWLDHYNEPAFAAETEPFSPQMLALIARVGQIDFGCARSLAQFFEWLPDDAPARLRNVQCEVLAARFDRVAYHGTEQMAEVAIKELERLCFVGFAERLDRDLRLLFSVLGIDAAPLVSRQNTLSSRRSIDLRDRGIRRVLAAQMQADCALYRHVRTVRSGWLGRLTGRRRTPR